MMSDLRKELMNQKIETENGAIGYKYSGSALVDLNFKLTSMRNWNEDSIYKEFMKAFHEDKMLALKWLFYGRDIRGGAGERRVFRVIFKNLAKEYPAIVRSLIPLVPEYGRWDDLWCLLDIEEVKNDVIDLIVDQWNKDADSWSSGKSISLLSKWLPSANTSSKESRRLAKIIYLGIGFSKSSYQDGLKKFREYSNVLESKISRNKWDKVNYASVPSKANLLYKNAFMKHDEERRKEYLESLQKGETKINGGVNFPYDIVHKYYCSMYDVTLEELWKSLPNYCLDKDVIVVSDDSGSMFQNVGKTKVTAFEVSASLAIYFSERLHGEYKDKYISFSMNPKFMDLSKCKTLKDKIRYVYHHAEVANTDIYKTFKLILNTAIKNNYTQEQLPDSVLIISDMEFDCMAYGSRDLSLFDNIAKEFKEYGYDLPQCVFWNVCNRSGAIPMNQNKQGVVLLSGFSPAVIKIALTGKTNPYEALIEVLNGDRYKIVEEMLLHE